MSRIGADGPDGADRADDEVGPDSPVAAFDRTVDGWFDHLRGNHLADSTAAVLSNLSDYGFVWSVVAAAKGRRRGWSRRRARRALTVAGLASWGANTGIKAVVQRGRPAGMPATGGEGLPVRRPTSTSFPSGHTLASFCTAVVLADGGGELVVFLTFAGAVAASRVHLRAHHPSDVVGGALIGVAVGTVARRLVPRRR